MANNLLSNVKPLNFLYNVLNVIGSKTIIDHFIIHISNFNFIEKYKTGKKCFDMIFYKF